MCPHGFFCFTKAGCFWFFPVRGWGKGVGKPWGGAWGVGGEGEANAKRALSAWWRRENTKLVGFGFFFSCGGMRGG